MVETLYKIFVKPTTTARDAIQFATLDSARYAFRFRYIAYDDAWRMWLLDLDETRIAGPIRLVPGIDLLAPYKYDLRVPQGQLFLFSETREEGTLANIDSTVSLFYRPPA